MLRLLDDEIDSARYRAQIAMMRTTGKKVHNPLVFIGVNHLIIKHDQIPFVHIKIGILLQSRRNSLNEVNVWHGD